MITHEFDLDATPPAAVTAAPGTTETVTRGTGWRPGRVLTLTVLGLAGTAIGALVSAAPTGRPVPAPITATMSAQNVSLVGARPSVVLEVMVVNPRPEAVTVTELELDDSPGRLRLPLAATIAANSAGVIPVTTHPECTAAASGTGSGGSGGLELTGRLRISDGSLLPLVADDDLSRRGGLCALLDQDLPPGWRSPVTALSAAIVGSDLLIDVPGLSGQDLVGSAGDGVVVQDLAIYIGDRVAEADLTGASQLRLRAPAPCLNGSVGDPVPMSLRILIRDHGDLQSLLVQVGPQLAQWVTSRC